jgi:hypothetical protein
MFAINADIIVRPASNMKINALLVKELIEEQISLCAHAKLDFLIKE